MSNSLENKVSLLTALLGRLRSIMLSRFILSLRSFSDPLAHHDIDSSNHSDVLGDFGEPLRFAHDDDNDDDDYGDLELTHTTRRNLSWSST